MSEKLEILQIWQQMVCILQDKNEGHQDKVSYFYPPLFERILAPQNQQ
jgi:hypothetical protein